jgi:nucleotide-binding universal stress UspA family protein
MIKPHYSIRMSACYNEDVNSIGEGYKMSQGYKKILVAVDGSEASKLALLKAIELAKSNKAKLIITHVIDTTSYSMIASYSVTISERAKEFAEELLNECQNEAVDANIENVVVHLDYGSPKVRIPRVIAKEFDVDLIVCGATGHNAVERFLIGSVSEHITRYAKTDVLVVKNDD